MWYQLRGLKVIGFHFRRQAPFRSYILDFVEHTRGLVIELDGAQHADIRHKLRDEIRDRTLTAEGYQVLRFSNLDVLENIDGTIEYIVSVLNARPHPEGYAVRPPHKGEVEFKTSSTELSCFAGRRSYRRTRTRLSRFAFL